MSLEGKTINELSKTETLKDDTKFVVDNGASEANYLLFSKIKSIILSIIDSLKVSKTGDTMTGPLMVPTASVESSDTTVPNCELVKLWLSTKADLENGKVPDNQLPTKAINAVQKTGDTMTGSLAVKVNGNGLSISHPEADITTTPTEDKYNSIYFTDKNGRYGGVLDHCFKATGSDYVRLLVCKNDGSNSTIRGLEILQKTENNNESWATFTTDRVNINTPDNAQKVEATNAKWVMSKFVSKSGDTMSGDLIIKKSFPLLRGASAEDLSNTDGMCLTLEGKDKNNKEFARIDLYRRGSIQQSEAHLIAENSSGTRAEIAAFIDDNGRILTFAPTPLSTSNTTEIATTAWVRQLVSGALSPNDYITERYSDDNGNWYEVYASGWIKQMIVYSVGTNFGAFNINLLKPLANTNYTILCSLGNNNNAAGIRLIVPVIGPKTTSSVYVTINNNDQYAPGAEKIYLYVVGKGV